MKYLCFCASSFPETVLLLQRILLKFNLRLSPESLIRWFEASPPVLHGSERLGIAFSQRLSPALLFGQVWTWFCSVAGKVGLHCNYCLLESASRLAQKQFGPWILAIRKKVGVCYVRFWQTRSLSILWVSVFTFFCWMLYSRWIFLTWPLHWTYQLTDSRKIRENYFKMACVSCLPKSMHLIGVAGWWFLFSTLRMLSIEKGVNVLGVFSLEQSASISQSLPVDLALLNILLMTVRGGRFSFVHNPSATSFSLTSQEKIPGAVRRYSSILFFTSELTSLEVFLCARPGSKDPVSLYLESSLLMQPCDTLSCLLISHGRMPRSAISIICWRTEFGSGLPFTNTPPSWLTLPERERYICVTYLEYHTKRNSSEHVSWYKHTVWFEKHNAHFLVITL